MTLNEFKQLAKEKPITLELLWRYGKTEFAPWLQGPRRIVAVRSYGFDLELLTTEGMGDPTQKTSSLTVERSALFQMDGDVISIYTSGCRPATEAEQEALDAWQKRCEENHNVSSWAQHKFFRSFVSTRSKADGRRRGYEYLINARRWDVDPETGRELIADKTVRGELALQYRVVA